ncbi:bifunctional riboflavin kinase/FAD synthetase [Flavisolibacter ginsenosidimutans]|uniref:Riboflavin biosynthesis protein n=1 Tax=Flavisolibacter ginsenosidimutans TaxID=661481 RepID=A0A5B8UGX2_9BACT|nr:bifunctional riboflavin kinase/FAD synthetase [Flavisolibacter ginsenosidimutans]QEC55605.1 bifunctional riboflavin kinase/FAD synthetase [Flavisolibacter ginsenosidimutans]
MQVHRSIENLPLFKNAVITIGSFDGVHLGHQKIIAALCDEAKKVNGETVIITFHPHPRKIVQPDKPLQLLNTLDEKIWLLENAGIGHLIVVPFTQEFSEQSADDYIEHFLIRNFGPACIIIGYDHRFGKGRTGNYKLLEKRAAEFNYRLVEIPQHLLNEIEVSSTKIRTAILESDVATANRLLGYSFFFEGEVVQGDKLGRTLGYPTANLLYTDADKIHLGHGVYAVYADVIGERKKGMMSIGTRPTLNKSEEKVEVNLFDFDQIIYGETMRVTVEHFLRGQEKYPSLDVMVEQLHKDKGKSLRLL